MPADVRHEGAKKEIPGAGLVDDRGPKIYKGRGRLRPRESRKSYVRTKKKKEKTDVDIKTGNSQ